jgi:predicted molibdopterin-dependent oxidoreductase YjgC
MDYRFVPSVCSYCGTGCGVLFKVMDGRLVGTMPLKTHPVNEGRLCIKGWNLHECITSPMRLKGPLVKVKGRFQRVGWDTAVRITAESLGEIVREVRHFLKKNHHSKGPALTCPLIGSLVAQ